MNPALSQCLVALSVACMVQAAGCFCLTHGSLVFRALCRNTVILDEPPKEAELGVSYQGFVAIGTAQPYPCLHWLYRLRGVL